MDFQTERNYIKIIKKIFMTYVKHGGYDYAVLRMQEKELKGEWDKYGQEIMQWYDLEVEGVGK